MLSPAVAMTASAATTGVTLVILMDCLMTFFGSTANDAAFNAWVTDVTVAENRGRVETVLAVLPLVAMLVVFGALDGMTQSGNWSTFFLVVGGLTLIGGLLGIFFLKESAAVRRSDESYFANIVYGLRPSVIRANPALYISLAALAIYSMSQQVYMPYLIIYIQRFLGITDYVILLGGVLILSSVVSVLMPDNCYKLLYVYDTDSSSKTPAYELADAKYSKGTSRKHQ